MRPEKRTSLLPPHPDSKARTASKPSIRVIIRISFVSIYQTFLYYTCKGHNLGFSFCDYLIQIYGIGFSVQVSVISANILTPDAIFLKITNYDLAEYTLFGILRSSPNPSVIQCQKYFDVNFKDVLFKP